MLVTNQLTHESSYKSLGISCEQSKLVIFAKSTTFRIQNPYYVPDHSKKLFGSFFPINVRHWPRKHRRNPSTTYWVILLTDGRTDRQTDRQTDRPDSITSLLVRVKRWQFACMCVWSVTLWKALKCCLLHSLYSNDFKQAVREAARYAPAPAPVRRTLQPSSSPYTPYACGAQRALPMNIHDRQAAALSGYDYGVVHINCVVT